MKRSVIFFFAIFLFVTAPVSAQDLNNKFGIHLASPHDEDLERAEDLVNSNGGEWGYITFVIQENDRDLNKWQGIFEKLREKQLIPVIRLATQPEGGNWKRPKETEAESWAHFLNKLNWVTQHRYIILFNEPNHATEWGGTVDPVHFAKVNEAFAVKLKEASPDFFIMMGGLDASAPSSMPTYEDEEIFLRKVIEEIGVSDFNRLFDGLSSHSYPNPGFVGSPYDRGRKSIRGYDWELQILDSLGIKELPVFITETGWNGTALSREDVARNFQIAYETVWLPDERVKAVTPFILNYQAEPFLQFSWVKPENTGVFPEFETVKAMQKQAGDPAIKEGGVFHIDLPHEITEQSTYHFQFELENNGQAIWSTDKYDITLSGLDKAKYLISSVGKIKPFEKRVFDVYISTGQNVGDIETRFILSKNDKHIVRSPTWNFEIVPLPSLEFAVKSFPKLKTSGSDYEIQLFDEYEQMVFRKKGIEVIRGKGSIERVENIALGRKYRIVILNKYYLPRQTYIRFKKEGNIIKFEPMLPFDFNGDGGFGWSDVPAFFTHPQLIPNLQPL
jgi:hypothetical protein